MDRTEKADHAWLECLDLVSQVPPSTEANGGMAGRGLGNGSDLRSVNEEEREAMECAVTVLLARSISVAQVGVLQQRVEHLEQLDSEGIAYVRVEMVPLVLPSTRRRSDSHEKKLDLLRGVGDLSDRQRGSDLL